MTKQEMIGNIKQKYGHYNIDMQEIELIIKSEEKRGNTVQDIYVGLCMLLGTLCHKTVHITVQDLMKVYDTTEEEIMKEIKEMETKGRVICTRDGIRYLMPTKM